MLGVSLVVTVSRHVAKRNFLESKLQFSFRTNSELSKFKFNYAPFCQRYALYGIPNCRTVEINVNNVQFWSSSSHLECLVLSLWKKESNRRMTSGGIYARVGKAEERVLRAIQRKDEDQFPLCMTLAFP